MIKKTIFMFCALTTINAVFGMDENNTPPKPESLSDLKTREELKAYWQKELDQRDKEKSNLENLARYESATHESRKRIDDSPLIPTPHAVAKSIRYRKQKTGCISEKVEGLYRTAYDNAPEQLRMALDEATKTPSRTKASLTATFLTAECCGYYCCPSLTYALNLIGLGWVGHVAYDEYCTKEKIL